MINSGRLRLLPTAWTNFFSQRGTAHERFVPRQVDHHTGTISVRGPPVYEARFETKTAARDAFHEYKRPAEKRPYRPLSNLPGNGAFLTSSSAPKTPVVYRLN